MCSQVPGVPVMALTATAPPDTLVALRSFLKDPVCTIGRPCVGVIFLYVSDTSDDLGILRHTQGTQLHEFA